MRDNHPDRPEYCGIFSTEELAEEWIGFQGVPSFYYYFLDRVDGDLA
jgi:hypothetical protein